MFFKKNYENIIYLISYIFVIIFYLYFKNSLFSHWSDILDQDVTLIYNSLLIGSNIRQEYLDHPAFTTFFFLNLFYKIGYLTNIIEISDITDLINHANKDTVIQIIHNISQFVHISYSLILILIKKKLIFQILNDNLISLFLSLILLFSPSFIFLFDIIRSEILSLVFIFLFYLSLENSIKKNILYIIPSGGFFIFAMLAKVQIILTIFPILIFFFIKNYSIKINQSINISKLNNVILNLILVVFIITIIDNFFYKKIDKIFFLIIIFLFIFVFSIPEKKITKQNYTNILLLLFFVGCSITIISLKILSKLGFAFFHPALIDIITSPISIMSNISTGHSIGASDNFEYFNKIKKFFFSVRRDWEIRTVSFLFDKFNLFLYLISFIIVLKNLKIKKYFQVVAPLFLIISIISINLIFNFRPYFFYDIYILPLNLLLISILIKKVNYKKISSFLILIIYMILNFSSINSQLDQRRVSGVFNYKINENSNMKKICTNEQIENKQSYMRYYHKRYSEDFLKDLCKSYKLNRFSK